MGGLFKEGEGPAKARTALAKPAAQMGQFFQNKFDIQPSDLRKSEYSSEGARNLGVFIAGETDQRRPKLGETAASQYPATSVKRNYN